MKLYLCFLNPAIFGVSSLVFSLLTSSSFLVCSIFLLILDVYSPCFKSSHFPRFFLFFASLFLFPCFLSFCLSLAMFVYLSLSLVLPLFIPLFFWKITFIYLFVSKKFFSFVHPFFCKTALFFKRVLSNKINWLFSFGRKITCLIPPRTYFLNFFFFFSKGLSSFFAIFFRSSLFQKKKTVFLNFWENSTQKWISQQNDCPDLIVWKSLRVEEKIRLSSFCRKMFLPSPSCVFHRSKKVFLKNLIRKIVFLKKNITSFISSWFLLRLYFEQKLFSIFQLSFYFFAFVVLSLFSSFSVRFFLVSVFPNKKSEKKNLSRKFRFFFPTFSCEFFRGGNIFWSKKECVQKLSVEFFLKKISLKRKK